MGFIGETGLGWNPYQFQSKKPGLLLDHLLLDAAANDFSGPHKSSAILGVNGFAESTKDETRTRSKSFGFLGQKAIENPEVSLPMRLVYQSGKPSANLRVKPCRVFPS
jgi:hypothetical protein